MARMWCEARDSAVFGRVGVGRGDSGVAIPPVVAFDKGGKCVGAKQGIVRF